MRAEALKITPSQSDLTRRSFLRRSALFCGSAAIYLGGDVRRAASQTIDIGLIAPNSGFNPHTLQRVMEAIEIHKRKDGKPIFPEFEGRDPKIISHDSQHDERRIPGAVERLNADRVQWVVSGDVFQSVAKVTEQKAKEKKLDFIMAASRMDLEKSNPHPYVFQILPPPNLYAQGTVENATKKYGRGTEQWLVVSQASDSYSAALSRTLTGQGQKNTHLTLGQDTSAAAATFQPYTPTGNRPRAILVVDNRPAVRSVLAATFKDTPVVFDTYLDDPLDLAVDGWPSQTYFSTYFSRGMKQESGVANLTSRYLSVFGRPMTPVTAYGAAAFQIIARTLRGGEIGKVRIEAAESLCGFGIAFNDQGINTAAGKPKLLGLNGKELFDATPR